MARTAVLQVLGQADTSWVVTSANQTSYFLCGCSGALEAPQTNEANRAQILQKNAGTFSNLTVSLTANAIAGNTSFTFRVNGIDGNMQVVVPASTTGNRTETTLHTDNVVAGDLTSLKFTPGATTGTCTLTVVSTTFRNTSSSDAIARLGLCDSTYNLNASSQTSYEPISGENASTKQTVETQAKCRIRKAGTIRNAAIFIRNNARTTTTTFTLRKNAADTSMVISITGGSANGWYEESVNHDVSVVAGDDVDWKIVTGASTENLAYTVILVDYVNTTGWFPLISATPDASTQNDAVTKYGPIAGFGCGTNGTTTLANNDTLAGDVYTFAELTANVTQNDISSASSATLMVGASASALTASITGSTTNVAFADSTHTVTTAATDLLAFRTLTPSVSGTHTITLTNITMWGQGPDEVTLTRVLQSDTLKYNIVGRVLQSDTLKYNIVGRVKQSDTLKYNVLKQIKHSDTLLYNVRKQIKHANTLKYNLIGRILHNQTLKYNVWKQILHANTLKYNVWKQVKKVDTLLYNVRKQILHSNTLKYNLLKQIKQSDTLLYNVRKQILHSNTLKYNVLKQILHANTLKYNVLKQITKQNTLLYNVLSGALSRILHANTLKYNVLKQVQHSDTLKYNIWKQILKNNTLKYNVLKQIKHSQTLKYNLIGRILHANTLKYNVLKQILANRTLKYNLIGRILHANTLKYNVWKQIKHSNTIKYNVLKQILHSNTIKYNLLKQVVHANTLLWNIVAQLTRVSHQNTLKYNIIQRQLHSNTLKYNIAKQVTKANTLKYNLLKQILHANTLKYNLIGRILHSNTLKYNVLKQIKHANTLKYNLIQRVLHANTLVYNVLSLVRHIELVVTEPAIIISDTFYKARTIVEDAINIGDMVTAEKTDNTPVNIERTVNDTVTIGLSTVSRIVGKIRQVIDSISVGTNSASVTRREKTRTVTDTIPIGDSATCTKSQRQIERTVSDSISVGDSVTRQTNKHRRIGGPD